MKKSATRTFRFVPIRFGLVPDPTDRVALFVDFRLNFDILEYIVAIVVFLVKQ